MTDTRTSKYEGHTPEPWEAATAERLRLAAEREGAPK